MSQFKYKDLVYPQILPWQDILKDLNDAGVYPSQISLLIGQGWSSLQRWRDGVEPRHSVAVSILTLHSRHCGEELTNQRITEACGKEGSKA